MHLKDLSPEWIAYGDRWGLGISWRYLVHGGECRVSVFFANPVDGYGPVLQDKWDRPRLYHRLGTGLTDVSLTEPLDCGQCWSGWLVEGILETQ